MTTFDTTKFSWVEIFLNTNGKTSSTKLIGLLTAMICLLLFVIMVIFYMFNIPESGVILSFVDKIITMFGIAAGLMGIKSISSSIGANKTIIENSVQQQQTKAPAKTAESK